MRYIRLYEAFQDEIDPLTRDIFGLRTEFTIPAKNDMEIKASGPSEGEAEAKAILDKLGASASSITKELDNIGWTAESSIEIGRYVVKGPFINWKGARGIVKEIKEDAKYACFKADKSGDMSDDEYDEIYDMTISDAMADERTFKRYKKIGYRIEELD